MKANLKETLNALNDVSANVIDLKNELNAKLNDELLHELVRIEGDYADYLFSVDVNYDIYEQELSIVVYYIKQTSPRDAIDFEIYCDRIRLIIHTTTKNAQKIASLTKFCETHILGGFDDK